MDMALAQIDSQQAGSTTLAIGDRDGSARRAYRCRLGPRMSADIMRPSRENTVYI
jgi:hypothetical protein